jgi:hypothetical protein
VQRAGGAVPAILRHRTGASRIRCGERNHRCEAGGVGDHIVAELQRGSDRARAHPAMIVVLTRLRKTLKTLPRFALGSPPRFPFRLPAARESHLCRFEDVGDLRRWRKYS